MIEQINDAVEDGSGCAEAWDTMSELRKGNSKDTFSRATPSRRTILSAIGAMGATGIGSVGISGAAKALTQVSNSAGSETTFEELPAEEAGQYIAQARNSEEYQILQQHLIQEYGYTSDASPGGVLEAQTADNGTYQLVSFDIGTKGTVSPPYANMSITLKQNQVTEAKAVVEELNADSFDNLWICVGLEPCHQPATVGVDEIHRSVGEVGLIEQQ